MRRPNSILPRIWLRLNKTIYGKKIRLHGWPIIVRYKDASLNIGDDVCINSSIFSNMIGIYQRTIIVARDKGQISIGNSVGMSGVTIYARDNISIGNNVTIGANTKIFDNDFHPLDSVDRANDRFDKLITKPVIIKDNVFIGCNAIITKGTVLGNGCIVGAGSVVHGTFPDGSVIAGNPARIVRMVQGDALE